VNAVNCLLFVYFAPILALPLNVLKILCSYPPAPHSCLYRPLLVLRHLVLRPDVCSILDYLSTLHYRTHGPHSNKGVARRGGQFVIAFVCFCFLLGGGELGAYRFVPAIAVTAALGGEAHNFHAA